MNVPAATEKLDTTRLGAVGLRAITPSLALLYLMWIFTFFEPQRFIPTFTGGGPIMQRLVVLLFLPTLLVALRHAGTRTYYLPLALFVLVHFLNVPFAHNRGMAFSGVKDIVDIYILFFATVCVIDTPEKILRIVKLFLLSFVWYLVQGISNSGEVTWHPELGNSDSFGAFAAIAVGFGFNIGMATRIPRWRYLGFATAALGLLGIVVSFARGAILAGAVVVAFIWLRSPRKIASLASGLIAGSLLMVAISVLYPENEFWDEVSSITEEGSSAGTGKDRWEIWRAALIVYREHPVLGVGAYNVGVVGSEIIPSGYLDIKYEDPSKLYNKALHNVYLQILSEEGSVGMALWLWMLIDFGRRTRQMRTPRAVAAWERQTGGSFDLRWISLALEGGMIAFLCGACFYNLTYRHWFFTFMVLAVAISESVKRRSGVRPPKVSAPTRTSPSAGSVMSSTS